jgi:hypothetical protein
MTMINRAAPEAPPELAFTRIELRLLDALVQDKPARWRKKTLSVYLAKVAQLGGYLARATDTPPGNLVMWRDLSHLSDIELGATIGADFMGN